MFLRTCSFKRMVFTPYNSAKSLSSITCIPQMVNIRDSISDLIRFCSMQQTYFCKCGMSRNGYAGLCGRTSLLELRCWNYVVRTDVVNYQSKTFAKGIRVFTFVASQQSCLHIRCFATFAGRAQKYLSNATTFLTASCKSAIGMRSCCMLSR